MQAIRVSYRPATSTRAAKWRAGCAAGFITAPMDYDKGDNGAKAAALALVAKLGWQEHLINHHLVGGDYANDTYFVFVPF